MEDIEDLTNKKFEPYQHKSKRVAGRSSGAIQPPKALQSAGATWYSPQTLNEAFAIIVSHLSTRLRILLTAGG